MQKSTTEAQQPRHRGQHNALLVPSWGTAGSNGGVEEECSENSFQGFKKIFKQENIQQF